MSPLERKRCCAGSPPARAQQAGRCQLVARDERRLVGAADQRDVGAHHVGDDAREVRVVRAAEQQRVDSGVVHRREQPLGQDVHFLAAGLATLDELDEARARRRR